MTFLRTPRSILPLLLLASCATAPTVPPAPPAAATAAQPAAPTAAKPPPAPERKALAVSTDEPLAPVNRAVLGGFDFGNWMLVADYQSDLGQIAPAELRFPGGEAGDRNDLTEPALDTFAANLRMLGRPAAVIQTRVGWVGMSAGPAHNRPEDAADAVRWARDRGLAVRYWEIGNEPDLYPEKQSATDFSPERYCEVFRAQAAAIKTVDPAARVAGPAVSGAKPRRDVFLQGFVKACGDVVDVLTWHIYPTEGNMPDDWALDTAVEVDRTMDAYRELWASPARNPKGHARKIELAVTEYGLSSLSTRARHLTDLPAAMWAMEVALRLDERGATSAHYFALQGTLGHGLLDQNGTRRPTWYAFAFLAKLRGTLVATHTGDGDLWAHAARDGSRLDVLLTNKGDAKDYPVTVPGWRLTSGEWFDEAIARDEADPAPLAVGPTVKLPARSIAHLVYAKE